MEDILKLVQKPRVDAGEFADAFNAITLRKCLKTEYEMFKPSFSTGFSNESLSQRSTV